MLSGYPTDGPLMSDLQSVAPEEFSGELKNLTDGQSRDVWTSPLVSVGQEIQLIEIICE